jgi:transcription antitermination factor NusG
MNTKKEDAAWFAVHTYPRAEKKVSQLLKAQGYEVYLPLQRQLRQWSDRKKWVDMPFIPSYLFVFTGVSQLYAIARAQGVVRVIYFDGKPVPIPDEQINWLKKMLMHEIPVELTQEKLEPGAKVVVTSGHLIGMKGELISYKSDRKVVVRLEKLDYSLVVTIPLDLLQDAAESVG